MKIATVVGLLVSLGKNVSKDPVINSKIFGKNIGRATTPAFLFSPLQPPEQATKQHTQLAKQSIGRI